MNCDIDIIEIDLLLEAIFRRYGYDFRNYARASIERRIRLFMNKAGIPKITGLIEKLLRDEQLFASMIQDFSITVTEIFRDPFVYKALREQIIPLLKTHPFVKIWHAGCATGEEAYSLAIVLKEEGLYDRATIFVTDFNDAALHAAKKGVYPLDKIKTASKNYLDAGGKSSFADYYISTDETVTLDASLRKNMTFANYNLVTDGVFGEIHLILCRNVLIYFNRELQNRVLSLFHDSLIRGGILCLGTKETTAFSNAKNQYDELDTQAKLYRKRF